MSAANKIPFEARLSGGHPNSLGDTVKVVEEVLKQPKRFKELFDCYLSDDEVVRLRTSNAMKRREGEQSTACALSGCDAG